MLEAKQMPVQLLEFFVAAWLSNEHRCTKCKFRPAQIFFTAAAQWLSLAQRNVMANTNYLEVPDKVVLS
jgi:hypothetical protein